MKKIFTLALLVLSASVFGQLYVKPTATDASYVYVKGTYLYVENDVELETNTTASGTSSVFPSLALREGGQLLQRNNASQNDGDGLLSVFQEGTSDNFAYNYWGSPVGFANGSTATGNAPFQAGSTNSVLFVPTTQLNSNPTLDAPAFDGSSVNGNARIAKYWIFRKPNGNDYTSWIQVGGTGTVAAGYGFTMKGSSGTDATTITGETGANNPGSAQRYDFRGRPNTGNTATIAVNPTDEILVGNPFPSAMDLSYFLLENSGSGSVMCGGASVTRTDKIEGAAYFWDSDPAVQSHFLEEYEGGYGVFTPVDCATAGVYTLPTFYTYDEAGNQNGAGTGTAGAVARRFSPVGQGFFMYASPTLASATTVTINNDYRIFVPEGVANGSEFKNSDNPAVPGVGIKANYDDVSRMEQIPQLRFNVDINDTYTRQLTLGFWEDATPGIDVAKDARNVSMVETDVYFEIDNQGDFITNILPFNEDKLIPITVKAANQSLFVASVGYSIDFQHDEVYLYDIETRTFHDILNGEVRYMLDAGIYENRFFITFRKKGENEETEEEEEDEDGDTLSLEDSVLESFEIFQNNNIGQLEIANPKGVELNTVALFDIAGKQIFNQVNLGAKGKYSFPTGNLSDGVYIAQIVTAEGLAKARKVTISNK